MARGCKLGSTPLRMAVTCLAQVVESQQLERKERRKKRNVTVKWRRKCDARYAPWFVSPG